MRLWPLSILVFALAPSMTSTAFAAPSGAEIAASGGSGGAPACAACHEKDGRGRAEGAIPRLAGLPAAYIAEQLAAFTTEARKSDTMTPVASALTQEERLAVAEFYARQDAPRAVVASNPDEAAAKAGAGLFRTGDWSKGVPPCGQCHGYDGRGVGAAFPPLAGQLPDYVANQLLAWRTGARSTDPLHLMTVVAAQLDDAQIAAVAAFVHTLPPDGATVSQGGAK